MIGSLAIAIGGIVSMMIIWIGIQYMWKQVFAEHITDEDVLADRRSCGNCGCSSATSCSRNKN